MSVDNGRQALDADGSADKSLMRPNGNKSEHVGKWPSLVVRPLLCIIPGIICVSLAVAWYPRWYGMIAGGGRGAYMPADKYADILDDLAKHGYSQLAPFAEQARKDAEGEQTRKALCWLLGVAGGLVGVYGVGDGIGKSVRAWKQRKSLSGTDEASASQSGTDENTTTDP